MTEDRGRPAAWDMQMSARGPLGNEREAGPALPPRCWRFDCRWPRDWSVHKVMHRASGIKMYFYDSQKMKNGSLEDIQCARF